MSALLSSGRPVVGDVLLPLLNQSEIAVRSYVCPSHVKTGSFISSIMIGHTNESGAFAVMFAGAFVADDGGAGAGIRGAGAPKPVKVSAGAVDAADAAAGVAPMLKVNAGAGDAAAGVAPMLKVKAGAAGAAGAADAVAGAAGGGGRGRAPKQTSARAPRQAAAAPRALRRAAA